LTITIDPDVIELPAIEEEALDPDDLEFEDPSALPAKPEWGI
jgi:hypothetical protein